MRGDRSARTKCSPGSFREDPSALERSLPSQLERTFQSHDSGRFPQVLTQKQSQCFSRHWNGLEWNDVDSLSLEVFQKQLEVVG